MKNALGNKPSLQRNSAITMAPMSIRQLVWYDCRRRARRIFGCSSHLLRLWGGVMKIFFFQNLSPLTLRSGNWVKLLTLLNFFLSNGILTTKKFFPWLNESISRTLWSCVMSLVLNFHQVMSLDALQLLRKTREMTQCMVFTLHGFVQKWNFISRLSFHVWFVFGWRPTSE